MLYDFIMNVQLTEKAATKIKEIQQAENLKEQGLRIRVVGGGCSGISYDLFFEDDINKSDKRFVSHGINICIDYMSYHYVEGVTIDYVEKVYGAGFKFDNPIAKATCGCGSSFAA